MTYTTNVILTQKYEVLKPLRVLIAGFVATGVMTLFMIIAPLIGLPKMNFGEFLGALLGGSYVAGWFAHFAIGLFFAYLYVMFLTIPYRLLRMCSGVCVTVSSYLWRRRLF